MQPRSGSHWTTPESSLGHPTTDHNAKFDAKRQFHSDAIADDDGATTDALSQRLASARPPASRAGSVTRGRTRRPLTRTPSAGTVRPPASCACGLGYWLLHPASACADAVAVPRAKSAVPPAPGSLRELVGRGLSFAHRPPRLAAALAIARRVARPPASLCSPVCSPPRPIRQRLGEESPVACPNSFPLTFHAVEPPQQQRVRSWSNPGELDAGPLLAVVERSTADEVATLRIGAHVRLSCHPPASEPAHQTNHEPLDNGEGWSLRSTDSCSRCSHGGAGLARQMLWPGT